MSKELRQLISAEKKAAELFKTIETRKLIRAGITEKELNQAIYNLAFELFGIKKYWHKRIVRSGKNTLHPYDENPENLLIQKDDILFIDFGPIFDAWEADYGRTYVLGNDPVKHKLTKDIEKAWEKTKYYFFSKTKLCGAELYEYICNLAVEMGWEFGGPIAGHLIGHFPHEKLEKENKTNYIHPENRIDMNAPDQNGNPRNWILEIHFVDRTREIGGFFEQLLTTNQ